MTTSPTAPTEPAHPAGPPRIPEGVRVPDIEAPRLDPVADYLLGGSDNSQIDRDFAADLVAAFPRLPQLAITAASWFRDAAQEMLDQGIRRFLILGNGGLPITAGPSTLSTLHEAGAQLVVVEHDLITWCQHYVAEKGAVAGRAHILCLPAGQHHDLAQHHDVADLLRGSKPVGILATALLRPRDHDLATILSLLDVAAPGSVLAITQLITDAELSGLADRFADERIPLSIIDRTALDRQLSPLRRLTIDMSAFGVIPCRIAAQGIEDVVVTALLTRQADPTLPNGRSS
ncbi:SAM-dependent methyltransferase [Amycolatopsis sp., V23-08]|uniref:SAM-dependent methyltransferase n=1 Tax=Amycolatopsis heterodermiae TaxID=3110235 RepID=A0ABU5RLM9_9PSEU|nr:SAM-dependent methyltransferase [Amycolatopsis sp., V23-08]MEA5367200.1 SAM-dependent methyltransferase [Amycolatopsis sp., V23-08]